MNQPLPSLLSKNRAPAPKTRSGAKVQRGVTLVEALVTMLVISIGLLGIAALQVIGVQGGAAAGRHSQAVWLTYDMADRMRANMNGGFPGGARNRYPELSTSPPEEPSCQDGDGCTPAEMARYDVSQWYSGINRLPNGAGDIIADPAVAGRYRIRVTWDEVRAGPHSDAPQTGCPSDPDVAQTCVELWVQP